MDGVFGIVVVGADIEVLSVIIFETLVVSEIIKEVNLDVSAVDIVEDEKLNEEEEGVTDSVEGCVCFVRSEASLIVAEVEVDLGLGELEFVVKSDTVLLVVFSV